MADPGRLLMLPRGIHGYLVALAHGVIDLYGLAAAGEAEDARRGLLLGGLDPARVLPDEAELARAAEILNEGSKVAILVGQGAAKAEPTFYRPLPPVPPHCP